MPDTVDSLLETWILRQAKPAAAAWFRAQLAGLADAPSQKAFDIAFGLCPRKLGKSDLILDPHDLARADAARPGWKPNGWSVDLAARVLLLLQQSRRRNGDFAELVRDLHRMADLGELLAIYHGLAVFEPSDSLVEMAALGLRTNVRSEFQAIAHNNPFPSEAFSENTWNNMVLKALFIGVLLDPIQGLDARANPQLAAILHDYAQERWSAGRVVSPELWRCVGPFAAGTLLEDFRRLAVSANVIERKSAALALASAPPDPIVTDLRAQLARHDEEIASGRLTWTDIAFEMLHSAQAITRKLNTEVEMKP